MRRLKKLGAALVVVAALGAVLASSALAAAVTQDVEWFTGAGPGVRLAAPEGVSAALTGTATFDTTVGGTRYTFQASGVGCVGCEIGNVGGVAVGIGKLQFEQLSVVQPAGCNVAYFPKELSIEADWMKGVGEEPNYWKFTPTAGEGTAFAKIEFAGCPQEVIFFPKGTVFFRTANATEVQVVAQEVSSSEAINAAAGGSLHVGPESAVLTAAVQFKMSGKRKGEAFGTH